MNKGGDTSNGPSNASSQSANNSATNKTTGIAAAGGSSNGKRTPSQDPEQYMPIGHVIRIMRRALPPNFKVAEDAKKSVQECVSEFINFIAGEANERCHSERRKTIGADDIIWAMDKLGFDNYVNTLSTYIQRYREIEGVRTGRPSVVDYGSVRTLGFGRGNPGKRGGYGKRGPGGPIGSGKRGSASASKKDVNANYDPCSLGLGK